MRKLLHTPLMAAIVWLVGMTGDAGATVTFDLVWTSITGAGWIYWPNTVSPAPGDEITLEIRMTTDQTLLGHGVSLNFDTDLKNELNLLGTGSWSGITFGSGTQQTTYSQIGVLSPGSTVESTLAIAGRINTYNAGSTSGPLFLPTGTYTIGTARFVVTGSLAYDGPDLFVGLFNVGVDDVIDNAFQVIPASGLVFGNAIVGVVPEPGAVALLGLGLVALTLARRRR